MWPPKLISKVAPIIFADSLKLRQHYDSYIKTVLCPVWSLRVETLSALMDLRDYVEDTWAILIKDFGLTCKMILSVEGLISVLKQKAAAERHKIVLAFLEENALSLKGRVEAACSPKDFVCFSIDRELEKLFDIGLQVTRFRPLLKCSRESIESVVKSMEESPDLDISDFQKFCKDLGLTSLWPVLAIWASNQRGDVEEVFLHCPLPRVFGAPSCVRNAVEKNASPETISRRPRDSLCLKKAVLAGHGFLGWYNSKWTTKPLARAYLVANLPGLDKHVWCLNPETLEAAIYKINCDDTVSVLMEFELQHDEVCGKPNWIDCQRDSEGSIVLLWGHINPLTGALYTQNVAGFDDSLLAGKMEFLEDIATLPNRRCLDSRIDYRDHGNLLSVHHSVSDRPIDEMNRDRLWTHNYEVVFSDNLLLTLSTDARPIEAIYGSPHDMLLLSPLSSTQGLQQWALEDKKYILKDSSSIIGCPVKHWQSLSVA